jgi:hypothetical protein
MWMTSNVHTIQLKQPTDDTKQGANSLGLQVQSVVARVNFAHEETQGLNQRDFYFRAPGSLVVLSFPQPLSFSSVFPSL